jgi:hypothetical protein
VGFVHRDGNEANERNEAHCDDADKGKNNGSAALLLGKNRFNGIDDFYLLYNVLDGCVIG